MLPAFDLTGKVALVTGAGQGIGAATARALARSGAAVVVAELRADTGEQVAADIRAAGGDASFAAVDVTSFSQVEAAVGDAVARHGRLDILVNNAGYYKLVPTLEMTDAEMDQMMAVNYKGVHHCCRAALPHMLARGDGRIVSLASVAGITGTWGGTSHYAASKGAVIALTRSLAREFGPKGIRANAVAPGQIDTQMSRWRLAIEPDFLDRVAANVPLRRIGQPEDIASAIVFLASDAASYVTGQVLHVCGGYLMA